MGDFGATAFVPRMDARLKFLLGGCLRQAVLVALSTALAVITPLQAWAEEGRGYLDMSGGYKTGDFDTQTDSDLYYLSPTLGYMTPGYDVGITVPYLSLTNETGGVSSSASGIGDVILRGGKVLVPETGAGFSLSGALSVKLPTADETKSLGTGEADYGAFLSLHQRLAGAKLSLMAGYILIGDPPLVDYNDISLYGIGISKIFGRTNMYASIEGRRSVVTGAENPREVNLGFFHILSADYAIKGGAFFGLNDGGPDFGLNTGIVKWF